MKITKKYLALLLCLALSTGLWGCASQPAPSEPEAVETAPPEEIFYLAEFTELAKDEAQYLGSRASTDEGYYSVGYSMDETHEGEEYSTAIYYVNCNGGAVRKLGKYSPVEISEELSSLPSFYATQEILGLAAAENGGLVSVESVYMSWYAGPGQRRDEYGTAFDDHMRKIYIRSLDKNGRELSISELSLDEDENIYADDLILDSRGNLLMTEQNQLCLYSSTGEELGRLEPGGYVRSVHSGGDGEIAVLCYGEEDTQLLHFVSSEKMEIERTVSIPADTMHFCLGNGELDAGYSWGNSFYLYDFESGRSAELFDWLACGVDPAKISDVKLNADGTVQCVSNEYDEESESYSTFFVRLSPYIGSPAKKTLTLGSAAPDYRLVDNIVRFNRSDAPCCIKLEDYSMRFDFQTEGQKGRVMIELLSGNMPDILDLSGFNHHLLHRKGYLEDLNVYLEKDDELSRDCFFANVLSAYECEGELCAIGSSFSVDTVLGSAQRHGAKPGWSYRDYYEALALMPAGCQPFEVYITSEDILRTGLAMELNNYVNWSKLTVDFENENFIALLEFAGSFPDYFNWDTYNWSDVDIVENRLLQERQMLLRTSLFSIEEIFYNSIYFGGDVSYIGYPTWDGSAGNVLDVWGGLAISRSCTDKDSAWSFVRSFLTKDAQQSQWTFPTNINAFEASLEEAMTPDYLQDEEGELIVDEEGNSTELPQGHMGTVLGVRSFRSLTEAQAEQLRQLLTGCEKIKCSNAALADVVVNASRLYFEAQQGAEATAATVEQAVENYLSQYK